MFEKIMRAELSFPTFMTQVDGCAFISYATAALTLFSSPFISLPLLPACSPACLPACTLTSSHLSSLSKYSILLHPTFNVLHSSFPVHSTKHQNARSLLSQLLQRDPKERLGSGDGDAWEVKEHVFFWYVTFCLIVFIHSPSISSFICMKELLTIYIPYIVNLIKYRISSSFSP
jgi:serine/threonine protein kinase